jgi:hypothetical protein
MSRLSSVAALAAACALATTGATTGALAQQQPPFFTCGGSPPQKVTLEPKPSFTVIDFSDPGADCALWQTFFYLNWPAQKGQRGIPNQNARFGAPGTTVWETFRTLETVFLPEGRSPPPWDQGLLNASLAHDLGAEVAAGDVRLLTRESKISRLVIDHIAQTKINDPIFLDDIRQADGNILYDQQKRPVYYEIAMNRAQFDYIVNNGLYNSATQATFATKTNIALQVGTIEIKAAWKILTTAEINSGRFHTARAFISGPILIPVTVGLVGMHVFAGGGFESVGLWGTFVQIDNAPVQPATDIKGPYSFFNPACAGCPLNSTRTNPTQVVQVFPAESHAEEVNGRAINMIQQYDPKDVWQYYKLLNVQWSPGTFDFKTPVPRMLPLPPPPGRANTLTLMNPVLETFMQRPGVSCVGCHRHLASTASDGNIASGYSFMFSYAQAPSP